MTRPTNGLRPFAKKRHRTSLVMRGSTPRKGILRHSSISSRNTRFYWLLLTPALLLGLVLIAYPLYLVVSMSLRDVGLVSVATLNEAPLTWTNFQELWLDPSIRDSLWLSLAYTVGATFPAFVLGLATAVLLNKQFPGRRLMRTLILLPWAVPTVLAAIAFLWILDSSYGVLNYILVSLGIVQENIGWLASTNTAMVAVILPTVWKTYPFFTLILLAALQAVPEELYEAAAVDGAGAVRKFKSVTWPVIRPAAYLAIILQGLWTFREFDVIYPMTKGGPASSTETLAIRVYNEAFNLFHMGFASAIGVLTVVIGVIAVALVYPRLKQEFF